MYGAQANLVEALDKASFENDVEMYGAQAKKLIHTNANMFENDVEMYGAQAFSCFCTPL